MKYTMKLVIKYNISIQVGKIYEEPNNDLPTNNDTERRFEKVRVTIEEETLTRFKATIIVDNSGNSYVYREWLGINKKRWKLGRNKTFNDNYNFIVVAYNVEKTEKLENIIDWFELYVTSEKEEYGLVKEVYDTDGNWIYFYIELFTK